MRETRTPTDALLKLRAYQLQTENDITREIWQLRTRMVPISWGQIGEALGVTKQAAHKKYAHLDHADDPDEYDALTTD